ncbi:MAG: carbohydrate kinase family protein [Vicinamibacterales bacterium]
MPNPFFLLPLRAAGSATVDVAGLGECSVDTTVQVDGFPRPDSKVAAASIVERPGGQVATAVRALARLGWSARYAGSVGDDAGGALLMEALRLDGVNCDACRVVPGVSTRRAVVLVDAVAGTRTVLEFRDPRLNRPADVIPAVVAGARVLLVDGTDMDAAVRAARLARAEGTRVVVDIDEGVAGPEPLLAEADVVIISQRCAEAAGGASGAAGGARVVAARHPLAAVVCVTLGEAGCLARCGEDEVHSPGFRVPCVDTTGAGDVFRAGFIAAWLRAPEGRALRDLLRYANAAAALNCRAVGAQGGLPTHADVQGLLDSGAGREA